MNIKQVLSDKWKLRRTKRGDKEIFNEVENARNEYKKRSLEEDRYFLLSSKSADMSFARLTVSAMNTKYFFDLYKEWDDIGSIPLETGEWLEELVNDPNNRVALYCLADDQNHHDLQDIFTNGLQNPIKEDPLASKPLKAIPEPNKILSMMNNVLFTNIYLKTLAREARTSDLDRGGIGILVNFPADMVDTSGTVIGNHWDEIYDMVNGIPCIKPQYLLGYVVNQNGNCTYHAKEEILEKKASL